MDEAHDDDWRGCWLTMSPKSIYAWVKQGTLPAVILGASIRFDPATTAKWLRDRSA
jgi:predicted DNA-binding transcriptional regulator AlpA